MTKKIIQIKHRWDGSVLFEVEADSTKEAVEMAVKDRASLVEANLVGASLDRASLVGANLVGASLVGANLVGASLVGASLVGANLVGASLDGANLVGANLDGASLAGAKGINKYRVTPLLLLHDQIGKIRAYKLVDRDGKSPIQSTGRLQYRKGETVEVKKADCDETRQCAAGINVATLDWCMMNWQEGHRILVVEFTAKDIAVIPTATDGKFRLFRCRVVGEKDLSELDLVTS